MKKIKAIIYLSIICSSITFTASAQQGEVRMSAGIAGALPVGDFKDLVDKTSFRGIDILISYGITDKLGAGLTIGFQDFYQKFPRALYKLADGSDISAVVTNSIQTIPVLATAKYNFATAGIQPYASLGAGGAVVINSQYIGESGSDLNKISFAARPSLGVYIPFRKGGEAGINLAANYTFLAYKENNVSNLSYFGVTVGIGFPMRN